MSRSPFRYSQQLMRCAVLTVASAAFMAGLFSTAASAFDAAALDRAKLATIGVLEDTQDQRTPDKPGKILVRGTGFHLRDGYIVTARRAAENMALSTSKDLLPFLTEGFTAAAMAKVGTSALECRQMGWLLADDVVVAHRDELLFVAIAQARAMAASNWRAPIKAPFAAAGRSGVATIKAQLVGMRDGGFISAHDFHIASLIAGVVTGGDVDANTLVTEEYLMALERKAFCSLLTHPKTQERIMGMLSTGKPLRN